MKAMVLEDLNRPLVCQQLRPCDHLSHIRDVVSVTIVE
jgi:hypothetical protein